MVQYKAFLTSTTKVADLVLAAGCLAAAFTSLYIFAHYVLIGDRSFTNVTGWFLYLLLPVSLSVLLLLSLRLKDFYKLMSAGIFLALVTLAYANEMLLVYSDNISGSIDLPVWGFNGAAKQKAMILQASKQANVDFDTRDPWSVVEELRSRGVDAVPFVAGGFLEKQPGGGFRSVLEVNGSELIPLGGISDKVTVTCAQNGYYLSYKSDEHGFNNPHGLWPAGRAEIVALGQSFVQGFCAPANKSFVDLIRTKYPSTLNLGFSGEGPLMQLGAINEYLTHIRPATVLWFYQEGIDMDLGALHQERQSQLDMSYMREDFRQGLFERQRDIDIALSRYSERQLRLQKIARAQVSVINTAGSFVDALKLTRLRNKIAFVYGGDPNTLSSRDDTIISQFREILARANSRVSKWGGKLYMVYLPSWKRFGLKLPDLDQERALIVAASRGSNIPIIDTVPGFEAQKDPLSLFPFRIFGHYNEAGHRVVAEQVHKAIATSERTNMKVSP